MALYCEGADGETVSREPHKLHIGGFDSRLRYHMVDL